MTGNELVLEIPAGEGADAFPAAALLPRLGPLGESVGLDGHEYLQLTVLVGLGSIRILRTWLLARAERLKKARVVWEGRIFEAYTPREVERLVSLLERSHGPDNDQDSRDGPE
jgi:hypothetical protein